MDQAQGIRDIKMKKNKRAPARVITVTSGKGGVGKTNIVTNLALAMRDLEKDVLIFDADIGLANVDVLLGLNPKYNLQHVLNMERSVSDIIIKGPGGIHILPAASGVQELSALNEEQRLVISEELESLFESYDVILMDTGAGISSNVTFFCTSADDIIIIASPEPTSITDAYALMKVLSNSYAQKNFRLIVNSVKNEKEAIEVYKNISIVADKFLPNISIDYIGFIFFDENVRRSVRQQTLFLEGYPNSKASLCISSLARKILKSAPVSSRSGSILSAVIGGGEVS